MDKKGKSYIWKIGQGPIIVKPTAPVQKKDFKNKIYICKKEAKETKYWLQLIAKTNPEEKVVCRRLWKECQELTLIFSKIILPIENKNIK